MVLLLCHLVPVSADQRTVPPGSGVYEALVSMYTEHGIAVPWTATPMTVSEIELLLERIDPYSLSAAGRRAYRFVRAELSGRRLYGEPGGLTVDAGLAVTVETYLQANPDHAAWVYGYEQRRSFLQLPLSLSVGGAFHALMDLEVRQEPVLEWEKPDNYVNVPLSFGEIDYHFPYRALLSFGGNNWNLQFGRDQLSWGNGMSGNFLLSDYPDYYDFIGASTFWRNLRYSALVISMESWDESNISLVSELHRTMMAHRLSVRLFDRLSVSVSESLMLEGKYAEFRYYNPMMIYHNWFLNDRYGNINFTIEAEFTPWRWFYVYGQFCLEQYSSRYEKDRYDATQYPQGYGFLFGADLRYPLGPGYLGARLEGAFTTPWFYLIEDQPEHIISRKIISNYLGRKLLLEKPIGYRYGPDTILFNGRFGYDIPGRIKGFLDVAYLVQGENDLDTGYRTGPDVVGMTTPSGENPERTVIVRLQAESLVTSVLRTGLDLTYLRIRNHENRRDELLTDVQLALWAGVRF